MGTFLSLVLTTRNRGPQLGRTLASVAAYTKGDPDLEVVVLDDGSTDDTPAIVAKFPDVLYHRIVNPAGWRQNPAIPINMAVQVSRGKIVVKACAEVAHLTPVVYQLAAEVRPGVAVFPTVVNIPGDDLARLPRPYPTDHDARRLSHSSHPLEVFDEACPLWAHGDVRGDLFVGVDRPYPIFFCGALLRDEWDRLGGYDPGLARAADIDLWARMADQGFEFRFLGSAVAAHQHHAKA